MYIYIYYMLQKVLKKVVKLKQHLGTRGGPGKVKPEPIGTPIRALTSVSSGASFCSLGS